jgi:RNA polymerase sigma factor (sigma-70 family)
MITSASPKQSIFLAKRRATNAALAGIGTLEQLDQVVAETLSEIAAEGGKRAFERTTAPKSSKPRKSKAAATGAMVLADVEDECEDAPETAPEDSVETANADEAADEAADAEDIGDIESLVLQAEQAEELILALEGASDDALDAANGVDAEEDENDDTVAELDEATLTTFGATAPESPVADDTEAAEGSSNARFVTASRSYLRRIDKFRRLTNEEVTQLSTTIRDPKSTEDERIAARNALVNANLKLVPFIVKGFLRRQHYSYTFDDLVQIGNRALIRAVELYDPTVNIRCSTYAGTCIARVLTRAMKVDSLISVPMAKQIAQNHAWRDAKGRASANGINVEEATSIYARRARRLAGDEVGNYDALMNNGQPGLVQGVMSLNASVHDEDDTLTFADTLVSEDLAPDERAELAQSIEIARKAMETMNDGVRADIEWDRDYAREKLAKLSPAAPDFSAQKRAYGIMIVSAERKLEALERKTPIERMVLELRFGLNEDMHRCTLSEVAEHLASTGKPLTRERIRQIQDAAYPKFIERLALLADGLENLAANFTLPERSESSEESRRTRKTGKAAAMGEMGEMGEGGEAMVAMAPASTPRPGARP